MNKLFPCIFIFNMLYYIYEKERFMKVGDLVICEWGNLSGLALVIRGGEHAALIKPATSPTPIWVSREYLTVINKKTYNKN